MTRQEKRSMAIGIVGGALIAGAVGFGLFYRFQRNAAPEVTTQVAPLSDVPSTAMPAPASNIQSAVQLSVEDQAKIGVRITEVRRESITEEIKAIGRVEEPETAFATVSTRFG